MFFIFPYFSSKFITKAVKFSSAVVAGLLLLNACLSPEDTPAPPLPKFDISYLLPVKADGQIIAVDIYHPENRVFLENAADLQVYTLSSFSDSSAGGATKIYYPYFVYLKQDLIYYRDLWPLNSHREIYVASIPLHNGNIMRYCNFNTIGGYKQSGNNVYTGGVRYSIPDPDPNSSGSCDDYRVFNINEAVYDRTADYPLNNLTYIVDLDQFINTGQSTPELQTTIGVTHFDNYFAVLPNTSRSATNPEKLLGRMIADQAPGNILWFPGDLAVTEADISNPAAQYLLKSGISNFSYTADASRQLIFFLIDGSVYVFDIANQVVATALDSANAIHTLSANANPNYANFFMHANDRLYFFDDKTIHFIRFEKTNTQALFPVETLADLTRTGVASLEFANVSQRYFYIKEILDNGSDFDLVSINQQVGSVGQRNFLAQLSLNASISLFDDHYAIYDSAKGINAVFDAALDYSDGITNQPVELPANTQFATHIANAYTPSDPGTIHLLLSEDLGADTYRLYYYDLDSGESLTLGEIGFSGAASPPTFSAEFIDGKVLLIRTVVGTQGYGVAIARIDREGSLTRLLPEYNNVYSLR